MKKYSRYIITIPLAIIAIVVFFWLSEKKNEDKQKTEIIKTTNIQNSIPYKFEDYSVEIAPIAKQAPLNLKSHVRGFEFKTAITNEYKKGPNFANHYTVIEWGCGTNCQNHVIVDNLTGNIIDAEIGSAYGVEYKLNSRLFVVNPQKVLIDSFGYDIPEYFKTEYYELSEKDSTLENLQQ